MEKELNALGKVVDDIDRQMLQRRERRGDVAADEHRARRLDRDRAEDRHFAADLFHRIARGEDRELDLQQVLARLDVEAVGAARDQALREHAIRLIELFAGDVSERREARARADRARDEARTVLGAEPVRDAARHRGAHLVELERLVADVELREHVGLAAERVRLDDVRSGREVGGMDVLDDIRSRANEDLVAAFLAVEIVQRELGALDHGPHSSVEDEDPVLQGPQDGEPLLTLNGIESAVHEMAGQHSHEEALRRGYLLHDTATTMQLRCSVHRAAASTATLSRYAARPVFRPTQRHEPNPRHRRRRGRAVRERSARTARKGLGRSVLRDPEGLERRSDQVRRLEGKLVILDFAQTW